MVAVTREILAPLTTMTIRFSVQRSFLTTKELMPKQMSLRGLWIGYPASYNAGVTLFAWRGPLLLLNTGGATAGMLCERYLGAPPSIICPGTRRKRRSIPDDCSCWPRRPSATSPNGRVEFHEGKFFLTGRGFFRAMAFTGTTPDSIAAVNFTLWCSALVGWFFRRRIGRRSRALS